VHAFKKKEGKGNVLYLKEGGEMGGKGKGTDPAPPSGEKSEGLTQEAIPKRPRRTKNRVVPVEFEAD